MRVLLVWGGPGNRAEADPVRRVRLPLLQALAAHGIEPTVALLDDRGGLGDDLTSRGIDVLHITAGLPPRPGALPHLPGAALALRRAVRTMRPALIDASHPLPAIAASMAATRTGIPVCYRRHHAGGRRPLLVASRLASRMATRTIVSNEIMRAAAATQDGTPLDRIDVTPSGLPEPPAVPAEQTAALRQSLNVPPHAQVLLAVGRLRAEKGFDLLLDAVDLLQGRDDVHLVLVGDGPEGATLRARAARAQIPVHMPGHVSEVQPWLALASMLVMPSRRESFGQVTLEAMASGLPIVATRVGGLQVALDACGVLVPPDLPSALAAAIRQLLDAPAQRIALGAAARRRYLARYTINHMASAWAGAWRRLIDPREGRA